MKVLVSFLSTCRDYYQLYEQNLVSFNARLLALRALPDIAETYLSNGAMEYAWNYRSFVDFKNRRYESSEYKIAAYCDKFLSMKKDTIIYLCCYPRFRKSVNNFFYQTRRGNRLQYGYFYNNEVKAFLLDLPFGYSRNYLVNHIVI